MKKYLIALSALAFATTSCYEKLNIAPPNAITNEMVGELLKTADDATVETIMGAIADALPPLMYGGGYNYRYSGQIDGTWSGQLAIRALSGNDVAYGYLSLPSDEYYNCGSFIDANNMAALSYWHRAFTLTNQANKIFLTLTEDVLAGSQSAKIKDYFARGLIIRAFGYLYAMENFGTNSLGMPIYTKYSVSEQDQPRKSAKETYDSIIRWASRADDLFAEAGVGFKATDNSSLTRGLTNYVIARAALLAADSEGATAATYLNTAAAACDRLIEGAGGAASLMTEDQYVQKISGNYENNPLYPIYEASTSGFTCFAQNPEAVYGFGWQYGGGGSVASYNNFLTGSYRIDDRLYNKIDANDYRKDNFHPEAPDHLYYLPGNTSFIDGGNPLQVGTYWSTKFANNVGLGGGVVGNSNNAKVNTVDFAFIRLSEIYLMKAECQARNGDANGAKATLNILLDARSKAGTTLTCDNYSSMAGMSALEMVQLQTRIEMWGEKGLEWYNNRRWNIAVNRAGSTAHWTPSITYPVSKMTLQIPAEELGASPNFGPQNPM